MPDWIHVVIRAALFMIVLFIITKILGKKQMAQLSMFEYVTGITIGNIGAELVINLREKVHLGVIAMVATAAIPFASSFITMKSKTLRNILDGRGKAFIKNGKVLEENIRREKVTIDEFLEMLRREGVFDLDEVEYACLEANGTLSVLLKKENRPLTPKDLGIYSPPEEEAHTIIMDGIILDDALDLAGKSRIWLRKQLENQGVSNEKEVFIGQVNASGQLKIDLYNDQAQARNSGDKKLLLASMHKCFADLEWFALVETEEETKQLHRQNGERMKQAIDKVSALLQK
ncbi:hypothetical protein CYL18_09870 [Pradoshia eiseniae]|uniref:YetF C-terminal domain-containing protein n=1 Tax=Pradoshia eiseniae TaxID=2064768 RepID=A0A2S7N0N1_9BACI|nr:DUF421 domain-containing protein [Pradoshia eiseniae]PQD95576.1 hypothetical protein CYL18_09870 [Pradoshia eiseniae]